MAIDKKLEQAADAFADQALTESVTHTLTAAEVRNLIDELPVKLEKLALALDEAQGRVFNKENEVTYVLLKIVS